MELKIHKLQRYHDLNQIVHRDEECIAFQPNMSVVICIVILFSISLKF